MGLFRHKSAEPTEKDTEIARLQGIVDVQTAQLENTRQVILADVGANALKHLGPQLDELQRTQIERRSYDAQLERWEKMSAQMRQQFEAPISNRIVEGILSCGEIGDKIGFAEPAPDPREDWIYNRTKTTNPIIIQDDDKTSIYLQLVDEQRLEMLHGSQVWRTAIIATMVNKEDEALNKVLGKVEMERSSKDQGTDPTRSVEFIVDGRIYGTHQFAPKVEAGLVRGSYDPAVKVGWGTKSYTFPADEDKYGWMVEEVDYPTHHYEMTEVLAKRGKAFFIFDTLTNLAMVRTGLTVNDVDSEGVAVALGMLANPDMPIPEKYLNSDGEITTLT